MRDKPYFDESSSPVQTVDFDRGSVDNAVDGIAEDPRDAFGQKLRAMLGLVLSGSEPRLAQARLAQLDQLLNPTLRPHDARMKWPGLRKSLQDQVARELASLADPDAKKKPAPVRAEAGSPKIENFSGESLNEK